MIDKENEESSENYDSEEDNQILITQEISSEESSLEEESDNKKDCDGICACSYKSINVISKYSKSSFNLIIRNYVSLINSIYFQFWYDKDKNIRYLFYSSKEILKFEFPLQMEQESITFGKFTLPVIPKSNLSFRIHKDIEGLDISQNAF